MAARADLTIVINPAPARPLCDELLALRPILTPNRLEAPALTGVTDVEQAASRLFAATRAPVVVTLGAEGVLLIDGAGAERIPALEIEAVDATGAGDAFNGVLAAELARGRDLRTAVRWAILAAGMSTTKPGARAGLPTSAELIAFQPRS